MRAVFGVVVVGVTMLGGCDGTGDDTTSTVVADTTVTQPEEPVETTDRMEVPEAPSGAVTVATTAGGPSGNRVVGGTLDLGRAPISVPLAEAAEWLVGVDTDRGVVWLAVDAAGIPTLYAEANGSIETLPQPEALPPGMPPVLVSTGDGATIFDPAAALAAALPDAAIAPLAGHTIVEGMPVVIADDGTVVAGGKAVAGVTALADTRVVANREGLVALLSDPTEDLPHGVLGDVIEAATITVIDPSTARVVAVAVAPPGTVFEALSPLWADVDGDGSEELVITASDTGQGARLLAYSADGELAAAGPPIGLGSRWLNLLGVAATGPDGEIEVVDVKTPHIGGVVRWFSRKGDALELRATAPGYSTHGIFSRNLDQGVIVDVGGDGTLDVVVPTQNRRTLVALARTPDGATPVASVPLDAPLSSNVAAVARADGRASMALATADGRLLVWP